MAPGGGMKPNPVKLRKLHAEMGRWVLIKRPNGIAVHRATIISIPPTGRGVYPRLGYKLHCSTELGEGWKVGEGSVLDDPRVTCEGCRTRQWHGIIECQARLNAIRIHALREQGHMTGLTTEPRT